MRRMLTRCLKVFFFISLSILVFPFGKGQADVIRLSDVKAKQIDCAVKAYLRKSPSMGFSIAIAHKGVPVYMRGFGWADKKEPQSPATEHTTYRTASIAKGITGVLALLLEKKGVIDLKAKARSESYLPELPKHHGKYTLEDLLTNRSKIRHYCCKGKDPVVRAGVVVNAWDAVKLFMKDKLVGKAYNYSTHAYTVFAAAVERKTNTGFCKLIEDYIAAPYGLNTLRCERRALPDDQRAALYRIARKNKLVPVKANNLSWKYAGGGMEISTHDLMRFGVKLNRFKILDKASLERLLRVPDKAKNYALGWTVSRGKKGYSYFAKSGRQLGARSYLRIYDKQDLVIASMRNTYGKGAHGLSDKIARIILADKKVVSLSKVKSCKI